MLSLGAELPVLGCEKLEIAYGGILTLKGLERSGRDQDEAELLDCDGAGMLPDGGIAVLCAGSAG